MDLKPHELQNASNTPTSPAPQAAPIVPTSAPEPSIPSDPPRPQTIDLDKILLPKKEVHSPDTAERVNAAALLEQELNATLAEPTAPTPQKPPEPNALTDDKPKENSFVKPLETYKGDIESVVKDRGASILSIAAAEAKRREQAPIVAGDTGAPKQGGAALTKIAMIAGSIMLVGLAAAVIYVVLTRPTTVPVEQQVVETPFITVDNTTLVPLQPGTSRDNLMQALVQAKNQVQLSLGLVGRFFPTVATTSNTIIPLDAQTFLATLAPDIPQNLLRNINPNFLLGIHSFAGNQPFLMFTVDSYEQGYAGMLAWEGTMQSDLSPLFTYTPRPHIPEEGLPASQPTTPTGTSTATSTSASTSTPVFAAPAPVVLQFSDQVVDNHDARVIKNASGDILFLWTFLDRSTLVITTNPNTLQEIISRLANTPVTTLPTQ